MAFGIDRLAIGVALIVLLGAVLQLALLILWRSHWMGDDTPRQILREIRVEILILLAGFLFSAIPAQMAVFRLASGLGPRRGLAGLAAPVAAAILMLAIELHSRTSSGASWSYAVELTAKIAPEMVGATLLFLALPTIAAMIWAVRREGRQGQPSVQEVFGNGNV